MKKKHILFASFSALSLVIPTIAISCNYEVTIKPSSTNYDDQLTKINEQLLKFDNLDQTAKKTFDVLSVETQLNTINTNIDNSQITNKVELKEKIQTTKQKISVIKNEINNLKKPSEPVVTPSKPNFHEKLTEISTKLQGFNELDNSSKQTFDISTIETELNKIIANINNSETSDKEHLKIKIQIIQQNVKTIKSEIASLNTPTVESDILLNNVGKSIMANDVHNRLELMKTQNKNNEEFITYINLFLTTPIENNFVYVSNTLGNNTLNIVFQTEGKEKSYTLAGFKPYIEYGAHSDNWNNINVPAIVGDITFDHFVTVKGEKTTAGAFADAARAKMKELNNDQVAFFNWFKETINISMNPKLNNDLSKSSWDYVFHVDTSHPHGLANYHFYISAIDKLTGKTFEGLDAKGQPGFAIFGWNKGATIGEIEFKVNANSTGARKSIAEIMYEIKQKTDKKEQLVTLSKYIDSNMAEIISGTNDENHSSAFEYELDLKETGPEKTGGIDNGDGTTTPIRENFHRLNIVLKYKTKGSDTFEKKNIVIGGFESQKVVGDFVISTENIGNRNVSVGQIKSLFTNRYPHQSVTAISEGPKTEDHDYAKEGLTEYIKKAEKRIKLYEKFNISHQILTDLLANAKAVIDLTNTSLLESVLNALSTELNSYYDGDANGKSTNFLSFIIYMLDKNTQNIEVLNENLKYTYTIDDSKVVSNIQQYITTGDFELITFTIAVTNIETGESQEIKLITEPWGSDFF